MYKIYSSLCLSWGKSNGIMMEISKLKSVEPKKAGTFWTGKNNLKYDKFFLVFITMVVI